MRHSVYFDNAATTALDPQVLEEMLPFMKEGFANPSSMYLEGRMARQAVDEARAQLGALINASAQELIFTSGATESNNLALIGLSRTCLPVRGT